MPVRGDLVVADAPTRILSAKVHLPRPRPEWVGRAALVDRLVNGRGRRLVLIAAPAGYGKSTLISQWRADLRERRTFAYVALDHRDNDPVAMWTAILVAAHRADPELETDDLLTSLQTPLFASMVLPTLTDRLGQLGRPMIVVMDDFHTVDEPACREQITRLLRHLPRSCQLVIASRTTPQVGQARLRAADDLLELGTTDLRFSTAELGPFVRRVSGGTLTDSDIAMLADRTEGWPAGAYLAALSIRGRANPGEILYDLGGSNRYIFDYLSEEVLAGLSTEIRQFLLRTSVLERFTAELCEATTGATNAGDLIEEVERANLFLIPLDASRRWYRYHHLFAQVCRALLAQEAPEAEAPLREAACGWLERAGLVEDAIEQAFAAGALARVIDLVAGHWLTYINAGRHATVQAWLARLGDDAISRSPVAAICAAWHAAFAGDREAVRRWLAVAEGHDHAGPLPDGTTSVVAAAAMIRATFGMDGLEQLLRSARLAAELEANPDSVWYGVAGMDLGFGLYLVGQPGEAIAALERAAQGRATMPVVRILILSARSLAAGRLGRHAEAGEVAGAARELVRAHHLTESAQVSLAFTAQGAAYARDGRLDAAREELEHSLHLRRRVRGLAAWPTLESLVHLANVALAQDDRAGAQALYDEAADLLAAMPGEGGQVAEDLAAIRRRLAGTGAAPSPAAPLTRRERTVLQLLRGSLSIAQIAAELYLSANTIKTHTRMIYRKLGVSSRAEAVRRARELGIL